MKSLKINNEKFEIKTTIDLTGMEMDIYQAIDAAKEKWLNSDGPVMIIDHNVNLTLILERQGSVIEISHVTKTETTFIL